MLSPQHMPNILWIRPALLFGPLLNWMVHRLLHYFSIAALHSRLKAHYLSDWDHRNLLHVWPLKAFSLWWISGENLLESIFYLLAQGRAQKWNEPANGPGPEWNIHLKEESCMPAGHGQDLKNASSQKQIKETLNWRSFLSIRINQARNTKTVLTP